MTAAIVITTRAVGTGLPNLGDPDETANITSTRAANLFYSIEPSGFLGLIQFGTVPQGDVFWAYGPDSQAGTRLNAISGRGVIVQPPSQAVSQPLLNQLRAAGIDGIYRVSGGPRIGLWPLVVMNGQDPLAQGIGDAFDPEEEYERRPL